MKNVSSHKLLLENDNHLDKLTQWINQPVATTKEAHRLSTGIILACLHQQLQSDIGRGLVQRILEQHATFVKNAPDFSSPAVDLANLAIEGHRLLGKMIPGRKSAIMRIIGRHVKLPSANTDQLVSVSTYLLFTKLALNMPGGAISLPIALNELQEIVPELSHKDYILIGASSAYSPAVSIL